MKKFIDLMPSEVLNPEEIANVVGGDNPIRPVYGCEKGACSADKAYLACQACTMCYTSAILSQAD